MVGAILQLADTRPLAGQRLDLHAAERNLLLAPGVKHLHPFQLVGGRQVRRHGIRLDGSAHRAGGNLLADIPYRHRRTCHCMAHEVRDGLRILAGLFRRVECGAGWFLHILVVVHVALRPVEEQTLHAAANAGLERLAHHAWPIG